MDFLRKIYRRLAPAVLGIFSVMTLYVPAAQAGMVSTPAYVEQTAGGDTQRQQVDSFLQRGDVQERLTAMGIDPEDAKARVANLSDQEVDRIAQHLDQLPAGGSSVIGAILLIFLVLLLTDILGFTDVFPFVKKTAR